MTPALPWDDIGMNLLEELTRPRRVSPIGRRATMLFHEKALARWWLSMGQIVRIPTRFRLSHRTLGVNSEIKINEAMFGSN